VHVETIVDKLKKRYNVEVMLHPPKVPYKETITQRAEVQGRHKKQTGGRGQFGDCKCVFEPMPRGGGFVYEDKIFGGSVPQQFRPAIEKGIIEAAAGGAIAGYPMVDTRARFLIPCRFGDDILIETTMTEAKRSSFNITHHLKKDGALAVEAFETRVWVGRDPADQSKIKSQPIPAEVLAKLSQP